MYISYNKYQLFGKIILLTIIVLLAALFAYYRPPVNFNNAPIVGIILLIVIWVLLIYALTIMILQLLFFPKAVEINRIDHALTVHYLFQHPNIIHITDIAEYLTTRLITKSTNYEGILLHVKSGRKYLFTNGNLSNYNPVQSFLDDCKINFSGHEKFNNILYFVSFFRYK